MFVGAAVTSFFTTFVLIFGSISAAFSSQSGTITSVQNGSDDRPVWKVSGTWHLMNQSSNSPIFNASFDMMKLDGSSMHKHTMVRYDICC